MIVAGSDLSWYLVALTGSQLATIETNLSVFDDKTYHLMVCGRDNFHVV